MAKANTSISVNPYGTKGILSRLGNFLEIALSSFLDFDLINPEMLKLTTPPSLKLGDFTFACFQCAKLVGLGPAEFAKKMEDVANGQVAAAKIGARPLVTKVCSSGPYLNIFVDRKIAIDLTLSEIFGAKDSYGHNASLKGKTIMVEYLAPNTNKPLHIGHVRNGILGTSMANLLSANGANVIRANNINDRGIHIVKSMLAYLMFGNGQTPESTGEKGDHFVGRFYVLYNQEETRLYQEWLKSKGILPDKLDERAKKAAREEFELDCPLIQRSYEMLKRWEAGDNEVMALWARMNSWVYAGFDKTNRRLGFNFERIYYESQTYKLGKDIILAQLKKGVCQRGGDESVVIDLTNVKIGTKPILLIRQDGTAVYMTQDIGLAVTRFSEIPDLTGVIYVVAHEQDFHFKALFEILNRYGYPWHSSLYHLSYGMVNLPSGKMKSREGKVVDADDLVSQLHSIAFEVIKKNEPDAPFAKLEERAEAVALGALKYMLVSVSPSRDIMFDPEKSVSFEGNTGPYLQYACVRISAIEEKASKFPSKESSSPREFSQEEFELVKKLALFGEAISRSAQEYDPSVLVAYLYETAKVFSVFYTQCQVVYDGSVDALRLKLCQATRQVLCNGLKLLGIPTPDRM